MSQEWHIIQEIVALHTYNFLKPIPYILYTGNLTETQRRIIYVYEA